MRKQQRLVPESRIKALIKKGRKRGYITMVEILEIIPMEITDTEQIDDIIAML